MTPPTPWPPSRLPEPERGTSSSSTSSTPRPRTGAAQERGAGAAGRRLHLRPSMRTPTFSTSSSSYGARRRRPRAEIFPSSIPEVSRPSSSLLCSRRAPWPWPDMSVTQNLHLQFMVVCIFSFDSLLPAPPAPRTHSSSRIPAPWSSHARASLLQFTAVVSPI